MKRLLIVDDNDKYAALIEEYFSAHGYNADRAYTATEGIEMVKSAGLDHYELIVTDITMEGQLAGVRLISYLHKNKYHGKVIVASTGFDIFPGMLISKLYFGAKGVDFLIPKTTVLKKDFDFVPPRLFSRAQKMF